MLKPNYDEIGSKVKKFLIDNSETLYSSEELVGRLNLNVSSRSLSISLSSRHRELGLLRVYVHRRDGCFKPYFAFSEKCGSKECFDDWCDDDKFCKTGKGNSDLKFYHEFENDKIN